MRRRTSSSRIGLNSDCVIGTSTWTAIWRTIGKARGGSPRACRPAPRACSSAIEVVAERGAHRLDVVARRLGERAVPAHRRRDSARTVPASSWRVPTISNPLQVTGGAPSAPGTGTAAVAIRRQLASSKRCPVRSSVIWTRDEAGAGDAGAVARERPPAHAAASATTRRRPDARHRHEHPLHGLRSGPGCPARPGR